MKGIRLLDNVAISNIVRNTLFKNPSDNIYDLYQKLNIKLIYKEILDHNCIAYTEITSKNRYVYIQKFLDLQVERNILYHELGHCILHEDYFLDNFPVNI